MKIAAKPILRRFGFRNVLVVNALVSAVFLGASALFSATTPAAVIIGTLLLSGFFRSLEFTSINVLVYADVPRPSMSSATSFDSMGKQLALCTGVAVGALALHLVLALRGGDTASAADFAPAFLMVAGISAMAALVFWRLPPEAGAEMAGRRAPAAETAPETIGSADRV